MAEEKLLTTREFRQLAKNWAINVENKARMTLMSETDSTKRLARFLTSFVDALDRNSPPYKVKFHFERYGVYRAYGAGKGYVVINGRIVKGYRVRSNLDKKLNRWGELATQMLANGHKKADINRAKIYYDSKDMERIIKRTPLDWIDKHINARIDVLANAVQEYYGDEALRAMLKNFEKVKIVK